LWLGYSDDKHRAWSSGITATPFSFFREKVVPLLIRRSVYSGKWITGLGMGKETGKEDGSGENGGGTTHLLSVLVV